MKYKTAFRLAVRLLGLYMMFGALPWLAVFGCALLLSAADLIGYGGGETWETRMVCGHAAMFFTGLYLFYRSDWIVNYVIPSNRPYCHECAYELTGLPREGVCPECGTAYRFGRAVGVGIDATEPPTPGQP